MANQNGRQRPTAALNRFRRIQLENWKNFRSADVNLGDRAFIVGPNAAGKSNFLDAFRFLHDICAIGGGLQTAVQRRSGVSAIRSLAARRNPEIAIVVDMNRNDQDDPWRYELRLKQVGKKNRLTAEITSERVLRGDDVVLDRPNAEDRYDSERLKQTSLEQVNANKEFRDIAELFIAVRYLHVVPQLIREPDRSIGRKDDPYGGDFLSVLADSPKATLNSRLNRIRQALNVAVPQLEQLELVSDSKGGRHLRGKYAHWRPQGAWQQEDQFSDGTLRLVGLLWALLDGSGPLLLEEPELSLHSAVVRHLPQLVYRMQRSKGRQVLISTHASEILDDPGVGADEILLIRPTDDGSTIHSADTIAQVRNVLESGESLSDAIAPLTAPRDISRLPLVNIS